MRWLFCWVLLLPGALPAQPLLPAVVHSRISFPGQEVNPLLSRIDWSAPHITAQYHRLRDSAGLQASVVKEPLFLAYIMLQPLRLRTLSTGRHLMVEGRSLTSELRYLQRPDTPALFTVQGHEAGEGITVWLPDSARKQVWIREPLDAARYHIRPGQATATIAGYACREVILEAGNNTLTQVDGQLYSFPPLKVHLFYTEAIDPLINTQLPYEWNGKGAVLRLEAWLDTKGEKKLLFEVTSIGREAEPFPDHPPTPEPVFRYSEASRQEILMQLLQLSGLLSMKL